MKLIFIKFFISVLSFLLLVAYTCQGQNHKKEFDNFRSGGVRFYLDKDSTSFFRVFSFNHIWMRYTSMNPGTTDVDNNPLNGKFDVGIRRNRSGFYFSLFDRFVSFVQFGITSAGFAQEKNPAIAFLDLYSEYSVIPKKLQIGYGLNSFNGVARLSNYGAPNFLYVDYPVYPYPIVNSFDQSGRQLGIYAKGLLGDFEYRISWARPFTNLENAPINIPVGQTVIKPNDNYAVKGYFEWQFLDNEMSSFPWKNMNHLGTKKIFNVGAGFYYHPESMVETLPAGNLKEHPILLFGFDAFLDYPFVDKSVLTAYTVLYNYDYGPNYLNTVGKMNPASGNSSTNLMILQGVGNSEWSHGTGIIIHSEIGYLLPIFHSWNGNRIQAFAGFSRKDLDGLDEILFNYDVGINYFLNNHHVKWGIQYSMRPIYEGTTGQTALGEVTDYKATIIFNTQIDF